MILAVEGISTAAALSNELAHLTASMLVIGGGALTEPGALWVAFLLAAKACPKQAEGTVAVWCSPTIGTLMSLSKWEGSGADSLMMRQERCLSCMT